MATFTDAPNDIRCTATVTLRDNSTAQCGRSARHGHPTCWQHASLRCNRPAVNESTMNGYRTCIDHTDTQIAWAVESCEAGRCDARVGL